ncbi:MAG: Nif3-like dinuclear metal center hexameric protein [Deltaproteobacteria bacterium]|nr:Nif3-like dinuclear metal center hexameric protein [Candidatus Zymogenaceae bacterium]
MEPTVQDIITIVESIAPLFTAESWDNSGFQLGERSAQVKKVALSLDATPTVIRSAVSQGADLLITHHPLIFPHITHIDRGSAFGAAVAWAFTHDLSIYSSHTPLDHSPQGTNLALSQTLRLLDPAPLPRRLDAEAADGIVFTGTLKRPMPLASFAQYVRDTLGATSVRYTGDGASQVYVIAVCGGSGGDCIDRARERGADVFVTGEVRHHQALAALDTNIHIVEAGHYHTEWCTVPLLEKIIREGAERNDFTIDVEIVSAPSPFVSI